LNQDLSEEIQQHLEEKIDQLMRCGMSRPEAVAAARREFGNVTLSTERSRDVWRWAAVEDLFSDIRFAFRQLRNSPAFTMASVLTLALGIGANTAVFSVVNAVILRPLPYLEPEQLISVRSVDLRGGPHPEDLSYPTFFDFRAQNNVFKHIVSYRRDEFSMTSAGRPLHLRGQIVSWDLFPMLGVRLLLGRGFLPNEEESGERVVILSHQLWQEQFAGDATIAGRTVVIDGRPHTVVGIAPAGFNFPIGGGPVQIWTTLARDADSDTFTPVTKQRGARMLNVMARLRNGVSIEQAQAQMDVVAAALAKQYPGSNKNIPRTDVRPEMENLTGDMRRPLLILLGAVGLVLLIACANVANLVLTRSAERGREFAVRTAIGAGLGRLVRQLITEGMTLSMFGCTIGVLAAIGTVRLMLPLAGRSIPRIEEAAIDSRVLLFSTTLAVITSLLFSLVPLIRMRGLEVSDALKEGSRTTMDSSEGLRSVLCVGQVALGLILLSGAGLLIASFRNLMHRDLGFQAAGLRVSASTCLIKTTPARDSSISMHVFWRNCGARLA
jgi:putative ABC transport system permease protein